LAAFPLVVVLEALPLVAGVGAATGDATGGVFEPLLLPLEGVPFVAPPLLLEAPGDGAPLLLEAFPHPFVPQGAVVTSTLTLTIVGPGDGLPDSKASNVTVAGTGGPVDLDLDFEILLLDELLPFDMPAFPVGLGDEDSNPAAPGSFDLDFDFESLLLDELLPFDMPAFPLLTGARGEPGDTGEGEGDGEPDCRLPKPTDRVGDGEGDSESDDSVFCFGVRTGEGTGTGSGDGLGWSFEMFSLGGFFLGCLVASPTSTSSGIEADMEPN